MRRLILVISFLLLAVICRAEAGNYIFEHIQISTHWINSIYQDNDGFIWISSRNGLYRCLGDNPSDYETVFEGDNFYDIIQDKDGVLWIKKRNGFVKYDLRKNIFTDEQETASSLGSSIWINTFQIDEEGNFWWAEDSRLYVKRYRGGEKSYVGSVRGQVNDIFCYDGITYVLTYEGNVYRFSVDGYGVSDSYPILTVRTKVADVEHSFNSIFVDSSHNIWLSQGAHGVWVYLRGCGDPVYLSSVMPQNCIQPGYISDFEEDADGNIWLISDHGGICICNSDAEVLTILTNNPEDGNSIASDGVYAIFKDKDDNIWLGYTKKGLSLYRGENKTWSIRHLNILHKSNYIDDINTTCEDDKGNLWFGTDGQGLVCLDARTGKEILYTTENSALKSNVITDIHCDPQGRIWIATFFGGMSCIEDGVMRTYTYEQDGTGLASENVWSIDNDKTGRIWIGTLGGGIQSLDVKTGQFRTFRSEDLYLSNNYVQKLECYDDGNIYLATAYGLSIFDPHTESSRIVCRSEDMVQEGLSDLDVDSRGLVWLDEDGILQVYDPVSDVFYTPEHPALKAVRGLIEDNSHNMWIITD